jgi:hypothetical protein
MYREHTKDAESVRNFISDRLEDYTDFLELTDLHIIHAMDYIILEQIINDSDWIDIKELEKIIQSHSTILS